MTSHLERWGERALGSTRILEPRIASRFEQALAPESDALKPDVQRQRQPSPARAQDVSEPFADRRPSNARAEPDRSSRGAPQPSPMSRNEAARAPVTPSVLVHHSQPLPRLELSEARAAHPSAPPPEPQRAREDSDARQGERQEAEPAPATREANDSAPRARTRSLDAALARLQAWMEQSNERADREPDDDAPRVAPRPPHEVARPVKASAAAAPAAPTAPMARNEPLADHSAIALPPAPPRIEVHIGTIIVRSPSTQHGAPAMRPSPAASLTSFLARRTAGRL